MTRLLPVEACRDCGAITHPWDIDLQPGGRGIEAWYVCLTCGWSWSTCWATDPEALSCPGCAECPAPRGSEAA